MGLATAKSYRIGEFGETIDWDAVDVLCIDQFPWYRSGLKQLTYVKLARTADSLHLRVKAIDRHASAQVTEPGGSVYRDSCFEFFLTPKNVLSSAYLNFEINCIGTLYLAYNNGEVVAEATVDQIRQVKILPSLPYGVKKMTTTTDWSWELEIEIPLALIDELYEFKDQSRHKNESDCKSESHWFGNFYRCGGEEDDQYAAWSWLGGKHPDYHQPMFFGRLEF